MTPTPLLLRFNGGGDCGDYGADHNVADVAADVVDGDVDAINLMDDDGDVDGDI